MFGDFVFWLLLRTEILQLVVASLQSEQTGDALDANYKRCNARTRICRGLELTVARHATYATEL
jgi:hypothetical protein